MRSLKTLDLLPIPEAPFTGFSIEDAEDLICAMPLSSMHVPFTAVDLSGSGCRIGEESYGIMFSKGGPDPPKPFPIKGDCDMIRKFEHSLWNTRRALTCLALEDFTD